MSRRTHPPAQSGATLLEVLIAMLLVSFGLLGIAGLLLASVRYQQTSQFREAAHAHLQNIAEAMRANQAALTAAADGAGAYLAADAYEAAATLPSDPGCGLGTQPACTPAQAAQRDVRDWRQNLALALPGGRGALHPASQPGARRVTVMWIEKAQDAYDPQAGLTTDPNCPPPQVAGVRCIAAMVNP